MTVGSLESSVLPVDDELSFAVDAHLPARRLRVGLGVIVTTGALGIFPLDIPTAVGIGDDMMFLPRHKPHPLCALGQQFLQPSASE